MATAHRELVSTILEYLALRGIVAWQNNSGAYAVEDGQHRRRFIRFGKKGSSDILGVVPPEGRLLAIEVKAGRDPVRPAQEQFLDLIQDAGGIVFVARSLDDVMARLEPVSDAARFIYGGRGQR